MLVLAGGGRTHALVTTADRPTHWPFDPGTRKLGITCRVTLILESVSNPFRNWARTAHRKQWISGPKPGDQRVDMIGLCLERLTLPLEARQRGAVRIQGGAQAGRSLTLVSGMQLPKLPSDLIEEGAGLLNEPLSFFFPQQKLNPALHSILRIGFSPSSSEAIFTCFFDGQHLCKNSYTSTIKMATTSALDHLDLGGRIDWLAQLDTAYKPPRNFRRTSIICTIGPKTNSVAAINKLRDAGLNVVRMNFSHGSYEYHQSVIDNARAAEKSQPGRQVAIALDTKGPEIRTGNTKNDEDLVLKAGTVLNITTDDKYATACDIENMYVDYKNITKVISPGRVIYVDDGVLAFDVLEIVDDKTIKVKARNNGYISSRKGVNLPNTDVDLPALSEKDKADLRFGVKNNVDMVFASFIRRGQDIKDIREVLGKDGAHIQIIAKIENRQGLNNFAEILAETDGVMVARGDLGIEIPASEVFAAQKKIIAMCNISGKPVICATQMLESMIKNPRPTRAEISDVGNAVTDGADCVMLSGETAKGDYPQEAVREMSDTCLMAENTIPYVSHFEEMCTLVKRPVSIVESCAMAAVRASLDLNAAAIFVLSTSGVSARLLSKYRPVCPIIMITRNDSASRYAHLYRGVYPFLFPEAKPDFTKVNWQEDVDRRIKWGLSHAMGLDILNEGETVVVVQGWKGGMGNTNTLRIVKADADNLGLAQQ